MFKFVVFLSIFISSNSFAQSTSKPNPDSSVNAEEQVNGLPGSTKDQAYLVRKKRSLKAPTIVAPVENLSPASCADSLGASGGANFTACEANKKTR